MLDHGGLLDPAICNVCNTSQASLRCPLWSVQAANAFDQLLIIVVLHVVREYIEAVGTVVY